MPTNKEADVYEIINGGFPGSFVIPNSVVGEAKYLWTPVEMALQDLNPIFLRSHGLRVAAQQQVVRATTGETLGFCWMISLLNEIDSVLSQPFFDKVTEKTFQEQVKTSRFDVNNYTKTMHENCPVLKALLTKAHINRGGEFVKGALWALHLIVSA